jgi:hypothetical protein
MLAAYVADSSVRTIIGSRLKDRAAFLALLDHGTKLMANMSLPDFYPSSRLAMLLSGMPRRVKRHRREHEAFMDGIVREHQENRAAAAADGDKYEEDLLDVLLRIQREGDLQFPLSTGNIKAIISVSTSVIRDQSIHRENRSCMVPLKKIREVCFYSCSHMHVHRVGSLLAACC